MNNKFAQEYTIQEYEYCEEILYSLGKLLNFYVENHSKVLVVRFDIHYPQIYTEECKNADISKCMAYVIKKYKRQGLDPYYMWVREQLVSDHPHYHCVLFLNAQKVMNYGHVFETVEQAWNRALNYPVDGCVHHCLDADDIDANGKIIRRDTGPQIQAERCQDVFNQNSYLAKAFSKASPNDGMRNFGMSRIPPTVQQQIPDIANLNLFGDPS